MIRVNIEHGLPMMEADSTTGSPSLLATGTLLVATPPGDVAGGGAKNESKSEFSYRNKVTGKIVSLKHQYKSSLKVQS